MLVVNIFSWFIMKQGRSEIDMYGTTSRMKQKDDLNLVYNQKVKVDDLKGALSDLFISYLSAIY